MLQNILIILLRFLLVVADKYFIDRNILDGCKLYALRIRSREVLLLPTAVAYVLQINL